MAVVTVSAKGAVNNLDLNARGFTAVALALAAAIAATLAIVALALAPTPAGASDLQAGAMPTGGANIVTVPVVKKVVCVSKCTKRKGIRGGSRLRIAGANLADAKSVVFTGSRGAADDVNATVLKAGPKVVKTEVPQGAPSGAIVIVNAAGVRSKASAFVKILPAPPVIGTPDLQPLHGVTVLPDGRGTVETGTSTPRVVFLGAKQLVRFSLRVSGVSDVQAVVSLVRSGDGAVVNQWTVPAPDGQIASVDWDGLAGGEPQGNGRYAFRLSFVTPAGRTATAATATESDRDAFDLYGYIFPIRGKHDYGMSAGRFGNDRGDHFHQGQDTFAKCGTRLVAARGGIVRFSGFQGAAGNYIVIDGDFTDVDMAYMHLRTPSPFSTGDRVYTGQTIGQVGQTGRAFGCHLHFEEWAGPGWYRGGKPFDPLPDLLAWDAVS